jgi:hypothetical protein
VGVHASGPTAGACVQQVMAAMTMKTKTPFAIIDSEGNPMGYGDTQAEAIQDAAEALHTDTGTVEAMLAKDQGPDCFLWADDDWFARWLEINPNERWGK